MFYTLNVQGFVGEVEVFYNRTTLRLDPASFSTFIQTDKPSYCPGQGVKIRVVSMRPDGTPHQGPTNIAITASASLELTRLHPHPHPRRL